MTKKNDDGKVGFERCPMCRRKNVVHVTTVQSDCHNCGFRRVGGRGVYRIETYVDHSKHTPCPKCRSKKYYRMEGIEDPDYWKCFDCGHTERIEDD